MFYSSTQSSILIPSICLKCFILCVITVMVLALSISLVISLALRSSSHAPTKRSAQQEFSAWFCFVGTNVFTNANYFFIADSLSSKGLSSRSNSVRNSIAVINPLFLMRQSYNNLSEPPKLFILIKFYS